MFCLLRWWLSKHSRYSLPSVVAPKVHLNHWSCSKHKSLGVEHSRNMLLRNLHTTTSVLINFLSEIPYDPLRPTTTTTTIMVREFAATSWHLYLWIWEWLFVRAAEFWLLVEGDAFSSRPRFGSRFHVVDCCDACYDGWGIKWD